MTSELGNVSPVLVAPSVYSDKELHVIVQGIASAKMHNAGFNCNSPQVIVTSQSWPQRGEFLRRLEAALESIPPRYDYYPGVRDRYADLLLRATNRRFAVDPGEPLQVTLVTEVDYRSASPLFSEEAFCPILAETPLPVADEAEFLVRAAEFANKRLAGNLNVTVFVPGHLATRTLCWKPLDAAIEALEYGTVSVNHWPGVSFGLGCTPWGAFPNGTLRQPRSGIGWVHNGFMLEGMEKVVFRGPLLTDVTPPWFAGNRNALAIAKRLLRMEASPSMLGFLGLAAVGIRG